MKRTLALFAVAVLLTGVVVAQESPQPNNPVRVTVDEAVHLALERSPEVQMARAEIDLAKAETTGAKSRLQPKVGLNGFATSATMQSIVATPTGFDPASSILVPEKPFLDANLALMVPIYTGGTLNSLVRGARATERAAVSSSEAMKSEVALMVKDAYLRSLLAEELAAAQEARVRAAEEMVRTTQAEFEVGKGIQATVQRAEAELAEARQMLTMLRNDRAKMVAELSRVIGLEPGGELVLSDRLTVVPVSGNLADFLNQAKVERGELLAARSKVQAAEAQVGAARGASSPQVFGFAMADAFKGSSSGMGGGTGTGSVLGLSVSFPLYDGGMRQSEDAKMNAMLAVARADVRRWELQTDLEVRQAWLNVQTSIQTRESALAGLESARASYEVATLRVASGKGILVEQLDALAARVRAQSNVAQATFDHEIAVARLRRAAGGI